VGSFSFINKVLHLYKIIITILEKGITEMRELVSLYYNDVNIQIIDIIDN
jgi:hypothetical protein